MQLGLLIREKCGIFIANSICIQYADLQILDSLPKSLLSKLADSLHFLDKPEETCWRKGDKIEYFAKLSDHGFMVCTTQCHLASSRGAGTSPAAHHISHWCISSDPGEVSALLWWASIAWLCWGNLVCLEKGQVPLYTVVVSAVDPPSSIHKWHWNKILFSKEFSSLLKYRRWQVQQFLLVLHLTRTPILLSLQDQK